MFLFLIILFIIFSVVINTCPAITLWDRALISHIQYLLKDIPPFIPIAFEGQIYASMIIFPIIFACIYFIKVKKYFDVVYFGLIPLITYGFSCILKHIVERPRPPLELHLLINKEGFSYVSNHTVISFCLWGMVVYYLINFCENKILRNLGIFISVVWAVLIGFSRVWLGVHNPTDVLAAYILGIILLTIYIRIRQFIEKYIGL